MEEKYGKLEGELKLLPIMEAGGLTVGIIMCLGGGIAFFTSLFGGKGFNGVTLAVFIVGIAILAFCIAKLVKAKVQLFENAIIIQDLFKSQVIDRDNVRAIYWDFPGANVVNDRSPRKNCTTADILLQNGKMAYKVSSAMYSDMEDVLGAYQSNHAIAREL